MRRLCKYTTRVHKGGNVAVLAINNTEVASEYYSGIYIIPLFVIYGDCPEYVRYTYSTTFRTDIDGIQEVNTPVSLYRLRESHLRLLKYGTSKSYASIHESHFDSVMVGKIHVS